MQSELQRRFDHLEQQRAEIQHRVHALTVSQLNWTPNADTWSLRQIVQHLVLGDESAATAYGQPMGKGELPLARLLPRALRRKLITAALKRDISLPVPSATLEPTEKIALADLITRWDSVRQDLATRLDPLQANAYWYTNPVLGPLTVTQVLDFAATHTAYHARQIEALQQNSAFPQFVALKI